MTVVSRWLLTKLSRRRLSPVWHGSVSCSRSSNRTGGSASGSRKRHTMLRVTPSTASEHNSGVAGLIVNPQVLRCFLRPSLTKAPSLHQRYPASSVLRTFPPPHTAQPDSRELPVDRVCHHRWGFPCCCWSSLPVRRRHYPAGPTVLVRSYCPSAAAIPITRRVGSCVNRFEACSAFTHVTACMLAKSPK